MFVWIGTADFYRNGVGQSGTSSGDYMSVQSSSAEAEEAVLINAEGGSVSVDEAGSKLREGTVVETPHGRFQVFCSLCCLCYDKISFPVV